MITRGKSMFDGKRILALIPARGGSKGIKDKNITILCGYPLIYYTINASKKSKYVDDIVVSTDSSKIAEIAKEYGAEIPFLRPAEFSKDTSKSIEVVVHAVKYLNSIGRNYDCVVFLQPTQPLRDENDIDGAIECFYINERKSLASVCEVDDHPLLIRSIENNHLVPLLKLNSSVRRQDMSKYYKINGCIYINGTEEISLNLSQNDNKTPFIMSSTHSIDIDEAKDLIVASAFMKSDYLND